MKLRQFEAGFLKAGGGTTGDQVSVEIEQYLAPREVVISGDVSILLDKNPEALAFFERLSFTCRKEYLTWIASAKKDETLNRRIGLLIARLLDHRKHNGTKT